MSDNHQMSENEKLMCMTALLMMSSERAMNQLAKYATDGGNSIKAQIVKAWDNFDRQQYAETVLSSLEEVTLDKPSTLDEIDRLRNLKRVNIVYGRVPIDILPLTKLDSLVKLGIALDDYHGGLELESISYLKKLNMLSVSQAQAQQLKSTIESRYDFGASIDLKPSILNRDDPISIDFVKDLDRLVTLEVLVNSLSMLIDSVTSLKAIKRLSLGDLT